MSKQPKAQFQVNHGSGWETVAEADIIDGGARTPLEWAQMRALLKRISYIGYVSEEITDVPDDDEPMEHIIKLNRIEPPEKIILDATEYYTLLSFLGDQIIKNMKQAETEDLGKYELAGMEYLNTLHKKLLPYQIRGHVELRLVEETQS